MKYLNGNKTRIAAVLGVVIVWAQAKGYIDGNTATMIASLLTAWTGVAVGHSVTKQVKAAK